MINYSSSIPQLISPLENKKQINIQFLRAFAALLVVFYHTADHYFAAGGAQLGNVFSFIKSFGYIGVDIFFVISGYIIWITTSKYHNLSGFFSFLYNRITRIFLGYWPYFILLYIVLSIYDPLSIKRLSTNASFFLMQPSMELSFLSVAWTLQFELYFYFVFSILLFVNRKNLAKAIIALCLLIILFQIYGVAYHDINQQQGYLESSLFFTFFTSPFCLEFLLGCLIGTYFDKCRIDFKLLFAMSFIVLSTLLVLTYLNLVSWELTFGYKNIQRVALMGSISAVLVIALVELEKRGWQFFPNIHCLLAELPTAYICHTPLFYLLFISLVYATTSLK